MAQGVYGGQCVGGHTAYIYDRGGTRRVGQLLDLSLIRWTRDRDGVSEAELRVDGSACAAQRDMLASIEPKRSELVIFRGDDRVWEGPVWRVGWHQDYVEIAAHDILAYVFGTPLTKDWDNRYTDTTQPTETTTRIGNILRYEMDPWEKLTDPNPIAGQPPIPSPINVLPHLQIHNFPNEARTTAHTVPFEMTVGEHLAHLAHYGGIDYTAVGRAIHIWDVSRSLGKTHQLTEADFLSEVIVTAYGSDMASSVYVVARGGAVGQAHTPDSYYGPWTQILTAFQEEGVTDPTQAELDSQAKRGLNGRYPVPVEVRVPDSSGIRLSESLTIHDLVPGVQVPLLATLNARTMSQLQKIDHVKVEETPSGENIQVTLTPATKPDDDTD
jgi:hypothetical protein